MSAAYPPAAECRDRLHRAGCSVGEVGTATGRWLVSGVDGENQISAVGATPDEAWWNACGQAAAVGLLAPADEWEGWPRGGR
jgi:hypothetical protein